MDGIDLRDARAADHEAMRAIVNAEIRGGVSIWHEIERDTATMRDWIDSRQRAGMAVIVAEAGDRIAGYGGYGPFRPHSGYAPTVEHSLYIAPDQRGKGIGGQLLGALVAHARTRDFHTMIGGIEAENTASIALHHRHGFIETGRLPQIGRKFDRWLTLVFMQRTLN